MNLFFKHEKEYFKTRQPKSFTVSEDSAVIDIGGIGRDTGVNERFVWGGYDRAKKSARKYLVEPLPEKRDPGRYRLLWF